MFKLRQFLQYLIVILLILLINGQFNHYERCFCKNNEAIVNCKCENTSIDFFNNYEIFPLLKNLLQKNFFKFYKVNMERPCPFWKGNRECLSKECGIGYCDDEVPEVLRDKKFQNLNLCETSNQFDPLDRFLSEGDKDQLRKMDLFEEHDDTKFCDVGDEFSSDMHYVNLQKNPERYTGYKGDSALKVWKSIYQENCFKPDPKFDRNFLLQPNPNGMCLEKRVFYRLISGFHTAITITIAANNYKPSIIGEGKWYRNLDMFVNRFGTKWSAEGPERLKNLYFVYLLELRAIVKLTSYLQNEVFYTGDKNDDEETKQMVSKLVTSLRKFPTPFDETQLFTGVDSHARRLREEFRQHFYNISKIMDCVDCDKCRLWGKLQTHGMGTALRILFSELPKKNLKFGKKLKFEEATKANNYSFLPFQVTRNDVVSLFQSFGRYASSIWEINEFRQEIFNELKVSKKEL